MDQFRAPRFAWKPPSVGLTRMILRMCEIWAVIWDGTGSEKKRAGTASTLPTYLE